MIAGARYDIDLRRPIGDRIRNLSVGRRAVSPGDSFTLAVNSHRQTGAGGYAMLRGAPVVYDRNENIRDLLIQEVRSRKTIDPSDYALREWRIVPEVAAAAVRGLFRIPRSPLPAGPRDTLLLRVLATADLHGALLPHIREQGSFERRSCARWRRLMDSLAADCACPTSGSMPAAPCRAAWPRTSPGAAPWWRCSTGWALPRPRWPSTTWSGR